VRIVVAHCASLGTGLDLDVPGVDPEAGPRVDNFDLFMRLMEDERYVGFLFADISAMIQFNRLYKPLDTMLKRTDLHSRLVHGSDYPLPAVNVLVHTDDFESGGYVSTEEREALDEIYDYNPLLFDFVLKRTLRHPETGARFLDVVFSPLEARLSKVAVKPAVEVRGPSGATSPKEMPVPME
jgi:uncharacterized protein